MGKAGGSKGVATGKKRVAPHEVLKAQLQEGPRGASPRSCLLHLSKNTVDYLEGPGARSLYAFSSVELAELLGMTAESFVCKVSDLRFDPTDLEDLVRRGHRALEKRLARKRHTLIGGPVTLEFGGETFAFDVAEELNLDTPEDSYKSP